MIFKTFVVFVLASGLAVKLAQHVGQYRRRRRVPDEGRQQRDDVSRWEHEGGSLRAPQHSR